MAMEHPDLSLQRARRAYEWGRLRYAAIQSWPVPVLTAVSVVVCHEPALSLVIGGGLWLASLGFFFYGRVAARAAAAGLKAGMIAFILTLLGFYFLCDLFPNLATASLAIDGGIGLGTGLALSMASARMATRSNAFLALAGVIATPCGMLACVLFGPIGLSGIALGVLLSTAPVVIYRRAVA